MLRRRIAAFLTASAVSLCSLILTGCGNQKDINESTKMNTYNREAMALSYSPDGYWYDDEDYWYDGDFVLDAVYYADDDYESYEESYEDSYDEYYAEPDYYEEPYYDEGYYEESYYEESYDEPVYEESVVYDMQSAIESTIQNLYYSYPNATFAAGVFDTWNGWSSVAEYNAHTPIYAGCQVKNSFCTWALKYCENNGIDIYNTYVDGMSLYYLISDTVTWSNVNNGNYNYSLLINYFGHDGFSEYQASIGGQYWGPDCHYGSTTVYNKLNEWRASSGFMNSGSDYGYTLASFNSNCNFSYIANGFCNWHSIQHKSGWCDSWDYNCAGDSAIVDGRWFVSIQSMNADSWAVSQIASAIEPYLY